VICSCNGGGDCDGGQICCSSGCKNPWSDEANCGACGHACGDGQTCMGGNCVG
jgi:hypothetical protein